MRIPGNWLSVQDLFANSRSRTRKRRSSQASVDPRIRSQIEVEPLEERLLLSNSNDPVFPDGLGHTSAAVRAAIQNVTTTGSQEPIYSLGDTNTSSNTSGPLINVDDFRNDPRFAGIDGSGYSTVILDTGIDLNHPFFGPDTDSNGVSDRIVFSHDFADNDSDASDVNGHGSNVSSIVASSDAKFTGMAPGANVIHLKVFQNSGAGNFGYAESALQWVIANAATYNIASINMSLSDSGNHSTALSGFGIGDELAALAAMDVVVVSASGNSFFGFSSAQGVGYPAADPNSISVGAVWDANAGSITWGDGARDITSAPGRITSFSQRSGTLTTIFAPGAFITGAGPTGGTVTQGGTSQASPHIAGIAVLAQELATQTIGRDLTFAEFTNIMVSSATTINDGDDEDDNVTNTNLDFPLVDVFALGEAILALAPAMSVSATDADKSEGSAGSTTFEFEVTRTGDLSILSTVEYVVSGSGTSPADAADFGGTFPSGKVSFSAGSATEVVSINVVGDSTFESNETFTVSLQSPEFGQLGTVDATGTIRNDDTQGSTISVSFADSLVKENSGLAATTATITRTGSTDKALLVGLTNGDASEIDIPDSVIIDAGQSSVTFDVDAVDDAIADGTQRVTVTATASLIPVATGTLDVRDNEVNPFIRIVPLGGLIAESVTNATLLDATDVWEFDLFLDAGETLAAVVDPAGAEQLTVELVSLSDPATSPSNGQPAVVSPQLVGTAGAYTVRVTGTGTTDFELKLLRNTASEQQIGDASPGSELAIDDSLLGLGRYAVIGSASPVSAGVTGFSKRSDASQFVDISSSGAPLNLADDGSANITTTVGNDVFPAGTVTVWNNGGITSVGDQLNFENTALPSTVLTKALLPFWDDIDSDTGNVYWQEVQVGGIDTLIVQWDNRPHFNNTGSGTFQLQLFASGPLRTRFAYRDVEFGNAGFDFGASATIGLQRSATAAEQFSFDQAILANDDVIDYVVEPPIEVDEFTVDLTGRTGKLIDIALASRGTADFRGETLELLAPDGTTVLATAVSDPVQSGTTATGFDLGIFNFTVPADGVYTLRITSGREGEYSIVATDSITFNSESNAATDPLRSLNATEQAIGFLDAATDIDDNYSIDLTAGLTVSISTATVFDSASGSPLNSLNPEVVIVDPAGNTVAANLDSAADGKNALAIFAAPVTGTYRVQVLATSGVGDYVLSVNQSAIPALTVDIAAADIGETSGAAATTVTISRTSDTTNGLTVDLVSSDPGEAAIQPTAEFLPGQRTITVDLAAIDDTILDGSQSVTITASEAQHDSGTDSVVVTDNETAIADLSVTTSGDEAGPIDVVYSVTLDTTNDTGAPITFDFEDLGTGSAAAGLDYAAVASTARITIADGASSGTLSVSVLDDSLLEALETIDAEILNSSFAAVTIGVDSATADIIDNETAVADLSVTTHGNEAGPVDIELTVTLGTVNNTGAAITFDLDDLQAGTATSGTDYTSVAPDAQLVVATGASSATLTIAVADDALLETVETVVTELSNSSNAAVTLGTAKVSANITDNDQATAGLSVTTHGHETGPTSIVYTVTLDKANNTGSQISFEFVDAGTGTAAADDYSAIPAASAIVIADGATTGSFTVDVVDDALLEDLETVIAQIFNPTNSAVSLGVSSATANITDNDATTLDLAVTTHGNETGPVDIVYTITLGNENRTSAPITFNFDDLGSGSASSGGDYTSVPANTVLSIPIGETTTSFSVAVNDDVLTESLETMAATIRNSSNTAAIIGTSTATADIIDNDTASAELVVTTHGSEAGPVDVVFTVNLSKSNNTGAAVTFDLDDLGSGTATSAADYTAIAADAQIVVANGSSSGSLTVAVINDFDLEATETLDVAISNSSHSGVVISTANATASILDNEIATANLAVSTQGDESGAVELVYTVTLSRANNSGAPITFDFDDLGSGTAVSGSDYTAIDANATIVVADGATSGSISVAVVDDGLLESPETVIARIRNASNATVDIGQHTAVGSIADNDAAVASLSATTNGDEAGPTDVVFTVALDKVNNTNAAIIFDVSDQTTGTAVSGADYSAIATAAQVLVPIGASSGAFVVPVINDMLLEATESLEVQVANSSNSAVTIGTDTATATIADNDTATASISASVQGDENGPVSIVYGVVLSRTNDTGTDIILDIADLSTGSATSGLDYAAVPAASTVTIAAGESTTTFSVDVLDDALLESTESVVVGISNPDNGAVTIGDAQASGIIMDDESTTANLSVSQHGSEAGPLNVVFTVTLTSPNNTAAPIAFDIDDQFTGTANSGTDYSAIGTDTHISVAVGETTGTLTVEVMDDALLESVETITAAISEASHGGVNLGATSATADIADNESASASIAVLTSGGEVVNTNIVYEVTLSKQNDTGSDISFDFDDLLTGTATSGLDYTTVPTDAVITVAPGAATGRYSVPLTDDTLLEATETLTAGISNSTNIAVSTGAAEATGTINDNETANADLTVTTQGNEAGPVDVVYTVSLDLTNNTDADITFAFADLLTGTAGSGVDYTAVAAGALVTVPIGSKIGSLAIVVVDDSLLESVESIDAEISAPSSTKVLIGTATATANISSDDTATAGISVTTHGSETGPTDIVYTVTLDKTNNTAATIEFDLVDAKSGSATAELDYSSIPADTLISIPVGSSSATFVVAVTDDVLLEDTETVVAVISSASNADVAIIDSSAAATIDSDDTAIADLSVTTPGSEAGPMRIVYTVSLDKFNDSGADITFDVSNPATGSAALGFDYSGLAPNSRVTIAPGENSGTVSVSVIDDALLESVETVVLEISNSSLAAVSLGTTSATADILDNETGIADLTVTSHGSEVGPVDITYTVTLDTPNNTGVPIVFDFADSGPGSASPGLDHAAVAAGAKISIADGETTGTISIDVFDDLLLESVETIVAEISNSSNSAVTLGTSAATAIITSEDTAVASLAVSSNGDESTPTDIVFTVSIDKVNNTDAAITFDISDLLTGNADSGIDYSAVPADAEFSIVTGSSSAMLVVSVIDDDLLESTETVDVQISNSSNSDVSIGTDLATATIVDNETAVADFSLTAGGSEAGPVDLLYTVTIDKPNNTGTAITFDFDDLATGTATSGLDYSSIVSDTVFSIAVGSSVATQSVAVTDDELLESLETVVTGISNSSHAAVSISTSSVAANIVDNETAVANLAVVSHGNEAGPNNVVFGVNLGTTNHTGSAITFDLDDLLTGTAATGVDYTSIPAVAQIVVADGANSGALVVDVIDDNLLETEETFSVRLSASSFGAVTLGTTTAVAMIASDERGVADLSVTKNGIEEGAIGIEFTVALDLPNNTGTPITFDVADLLAGTATPDIDYTAIPAGTQFVIADGLSEATMVVNIVDDTSLESLETVSASISNSGSSLVSIGNANAVASIADNESATASLSVIKNGDEAGLVSIVLGITLDKTNQTDSPITFDLTNLATGTAVAGVDYTAIPASTQIVIPVGSNASTLAVPVLDDDVVESTESVVAELSGSSNSSVTIGTASATATILSDDVAAFTVSETVAGTAVSESGTTDTFDIVLNARPQTDVVFSIVSQDLTEVVASPSTITFSPGNWDIAQTVTVTGVDDTAPDGGQSTAVTVSVNPAGSDPLFASVGGQFVSVLTSDDESGRIDVDADGFANAVTDGILIIRYLFSFTGDALIQDAIGGQATNTSAAQIVAALQAAPELLDVDGDGIANATTDGILVVRYLFSFRGDALVRDAIGPDAIRTTGQQVKDYLDGFVPGSGGTSTTAGFGDFSAGESTSDFTMSTADSSSRTVPNSSGELDLDSTLDIEVSQPEPETLQVSWTGVASADVYRLFIQRTDANGSLRRIDTTDTDVKDLSLDAGSYRVWVEAIRLPTGQQVASASSHVDVAERTIDQFDQPGLLRLALLDFDTLNTAMVATGPTDQTQAATDTERSTNHIEVQTVRQYRDDLIEGEPRPSFANPAQAEYSYSDILMEAWMTEGLWIE